MWEDRKTSREGRAVIAKLAKRSLMFSWLITTNRGLDTGTLSLNQSGIKLLKRPYRDVPNKQDGYGKIYSQKPKTSVLLFIIGSLV